MTTYTAIPLSQIDPQSPVTQTLMTLLRDNPIAIMEGAAGAPRMYLRAFEYLTVGDEVRAELPGVAASSLWTDADFQGNFYLAQSGAFRLKLNIDSVDGHTVLLRRTRAGVVSTVDTFVQPAATATDFTSNVPCIAADGFHLAVETVTSAITVTNYQICTNGEDLYPAPGLWGYITGNRPAL